MIAVINKQEMEELYDKALKMYHALVYNPEEAFAMELIPVPIEKVEPRNGNIKIIFNFENNETFDIEITLHLFNEQVQLLANTITSKTTKVLA